MKISVLATKRLLYTHEELLSPNQTSAAVICSSYPVEESRFSWLTNKLILLFDDTLNQQSRHCFSKEQAARIASFLEALDPDTQLFICCDSGESRSAAIAAAWYRRLGKDEWEIWKNPQYHPNELVYRLLCEALGVKVTPDEIRERVQINQDAFAQAIRKP